MTARLRKTARLAIVALALSCRAAPFDAPALVRGHAEILIESDGRVVPLILDRDTAVGLCVEIPDSRDTSAWRGVVSFDGRESPSGLAPPAVRLGRTVCFEGTLPRETPPSRSLRLCGRVVDGYDRTELRLPCRRAAFQPDKAPVRRELMRTRADLLSQAHSGSGAAVEALDALARRAEADGLPSMAVNLRLIAVHFLTLDGTPEALRAATQRLSGLPRWLGEAEASNVGALAALQKGELALASGPDYGQAWKSFTEAERRFVRMARPERFTVTMKQAAILSRMGATREASQRLRTSIADCDALHCDVELLAQARSELAWLVSLDPDAAENELAEAETGLEAARARLPVESYPLEHALQVVNLAYVQMRRAKDPVPLLREARTLLRAPAVGLTQTHHLLDWLDLFEGLHAIRIGSAPRALALCTPLAARTDPTLSAWALSCAGQAERLRGDLKRADGLFERALERHEFGPLAETQEPVQLAPGRGAEDLLWAVRTSVELGRPARAWELLRRVDGMARQESQRLECRASAGPEARAQWKRIDTEARTLYAQLVASSRPSSRARQEALHPIRDELKGRLRELWRTWPGCAAAPESGDEGARFRAIALPDEILLLERSAGGEVAVARRTAIARHELRAQMERLQAAMTGGRVGTDEWVHMTDLLARALLPPASEPLGPVTTYVLHGPLQKVPLAALPLVGAKPGGPMWLGQKTAVAVLPAAAARPALEHDRSRERPVFVVNPGGDLAGGSELADLYARLFPQAEILNGAAATTAAFRHALEGAAWLHLDTHGVYDPAFPELSALVLSDRPVSLMELADLPVPRLFANLSACRSGQGPTTPDAGRYGIAGLLVRRGVPWVVASTTDLDDRVARDFNEAFYGSLSGGASVPEAYRKALGALETRHPPAAWAPLLLVAGAGVDARGRSDRARLLFLQESEDHGPPRPGDRSTRRSAGRSQA